LWRGYGYPNDLLGQLADVGARVCDVVVQPVYADEKSGIRLRHALFVIPFVLARVLLRRMRIALALRRVVVSAHNTRALATLPSHPEIATCSDFAPAASQKAQA
jgi:hypothetical protein